MSERQPRILTVTSTFPRGLEDTTPSFVFDLARHLAEKAEVRVLTPFCENTAEHEWMDGVEVFRYRFWPRDHGLISSRAKLQAIKENPLNILQAYTMAACQKRPIRAQVRGWQPDAIHAHWVIPQGWNVLRCLPRHPRPRVLVTGHGGDIFGAKPLAWMKRRVLRNCDFFTGVSSAILAEAQRLGLPRETPQAVAPMGVNVELFSPDKNDPGLRDALGIQGPLLLFVGRLAEKKGCRYLVEALPLVLQHFPDAVLVIAGDGDEKERLQAQSKRLGLTEAIRFIGPQPHARLAALYASADVFIGPSIVTPGGDTEGFGLVFAEAMASGCCAIASDLPAVRDIITDRETGLFVPPQDVKAIAGAIVEVLQHPELRQALAAAGMKKVQASFSWTRVADRYAQMLLQGKDLP